MDGGDAVSWPDTMDTGSVDEDALKRMRAGDRVALRALFRRHMPIVYGAAFVITRSQHDAEEAAQDAFFLLWQKRGEVVIVGDSALPWLIATARFHASNQRRASGRRPTVALIESADSTADDSPETAAIAAELQRRLAAAISQLAPLDQKLVEACLVDGLSYEQAAAAAGVSHGTVRNRLSRAKQQIRMEIASERTE
jgi:RNA polymerase sigma factor (sigma-70 family)